MTIVLLIDALEVFVNNALKDLVLLTNKNTPRVPKVFQYDLPPKKGDEEPVYPFVLIRPSKGANGQEANKATIDFFLGAHSEDTDGAKDVMNMLQRLMDKLKEANIVDKRFSLDTGNDIDWEFPVEQPYPQWNAIITTVWNLPNVQINNYVTKEGA